MADRLTPDDEKVWHVRLEDLSVRVKGTYLTTDSSLPGWTLVKDHKHKVTVAVRDEAALYIERTDAVVPQSETTHH